ncbi:MAG: PQQ-dependent sugar dehydrogenase [Verrucomicrobiaceae bacterium]|nr:PQQ-dependent sugar dehydrogenase [Verrucomicrobiaceae bacterium]
MNKLALLLSLAATSLLSAEGIKLAPAWPNVTIDKPITLVVAPDGTGRQFLVQQRGLVVILPKDESSAEAKVFLDLTGIGMEAKDGKFEEGLVGFAFHPKFKENGKFYVAHSAQDLKRTVYAEYHVSKDNPDKADPTERVLLEVPAPYWNHHSGNLAFGPDGFLYIALGDGGGKPGGDPLRHAQNPFVLNAKILRIDVDRTQGSRAYGIPADNPFAGQEAKREEIFALGMRNPWGMSFDAEGTLWLADVGQELFEEINFIVKGGNYGWSFREGAVNYPGRLDMPPEGTTFVDPIFAYDHTQGISITGGFVYRGTQFPALVGSYIYGDWGYGSIWALKYDKAAKKVVSNTVLQGPQLDPNDKKSKNVGFKPTAFCEDANHEIIALDWMGKAWRVVPN